MKKLPIGIQTFSEIITENYVYIDKTDHALNLIERGKYYFLSRPRRFGKSLFLDTLSEIFKGNKELFKGLHIYDKYVFEQYPVINISFGGDLSSPDKLENKIKSIIQINQKQLSINNSNLEQNYDLLFQDLIHKTHEKYKKPVVILIDEYDKPILDVIDNIEIATTNREILKSFYTVIKDNDQYIKFAMLTGVTKFAKVSVFSGLNNLSDISLHPDYATIAGYCQSDIETTFLPYLKDVNLEKLKEWYNGYNFNGDRVYNPFDILLFISNKFAYKNYWFSTGTPTFLMKLLGSQNYSIPKLENLAIGDSLIENFDIENIRLEPVLFQSGYLTIERIEELELGGFVYHLKLPNKEVQISLNEIIISFLTNIDNHISTRTKLYEAIKLSDIDSFISSLKSLFASITYNSYVKNTIANFEGYYANVIYAYLASLGIKIIAEDVTNTGRIDLTLFIADIIYVFEFKVGKENALAQIKAKNYHQKYLAENKKIVLLGINFDEAQRNISSFEYEEINIEIT